MRLRGTIVVALLAAGVGLWAWMEAVQKPSGELPATATPAPKLLPEFRLASVDGLLLKRGGAEIRVRRAGGQWLGIERPLPLEEGLVALAGASRLQEIPLPPNGWTELGLASPRTTVDIFLDDRSPLRVAIGNKNPAGTAIYVRVGAEPTAVLAGAAVEWEAEKLFRALTGYER